MKLQKIAHYIMAVAVAAGLFMGTSTAVMAAPYSACDLDSSSELCRDEGKGKKVSSVIKEVTDTLLYILGAASVIVLIYGGIRYTTSAGNQSSVNAGKNAMIYAIVGLLVAISAYAIIDFIVKRI